MPAITDMHLLILCCLYFVERGNFFPLYIQATKDKILYQQTILRNESKNITLNNNDILQTQDIIYSNSPCLELTNGINEYFFFLYQEQD